MKNRLLYLMFMFFLFACKKDKLSDRLLDSSQKVTIESLIDYLSLSLSVSKDEIIYNESDSTFIVENDMKISRLNAEKGFSGQQKLGKSPEIKHYRSYYLVYNVSEIYVYIRAGVPDEWSTIINQAMANWNQANTRVMFLRASSYNSADIRITGDNDGLNGTIASAYLPFAGNPGNEIEINYDYSYLTLAQKIFALTHEFGHTVGFKHTNETDGSFIPGSPASDPYSIMNSTVLPWSGFTSGDIASINILYPFNTVYYSYQYSGFFQKNNCGSGYKGTVEDYTVVTGAYTSVISQQRANEKAMEDLSNNGQDYANSIGNCLLQPIAGMNRITLVDQEIYTFQDKPAGASVTWTVTAPLEIVGSDIGDSVTVQYISGYPETEPTAIITATIGTITYYRDIKIKYDW